MEGLCGRTHREGAQGAQGKESWSELQSSETQALGSGEEGRREADRAKGTGEVGNTSAKDPQDRAGQDPGEQRGGKEKEPKIDYLLDFLRTPELEGRERGKKREKIKAHINLTSQKLHFLTKRSSSKGHKRLRLSWSPQVWLLP